MPHILLVSDTADAFQTLAATLKKEHQVAVQWVPNASAGLERLAGDSPDLVIVDESIGGISGLEWIRKAMAVNAFVPTAVVNGLPDDAFHEASEGLGILLRLPPSPGREDARRLMAALDRLSGTVPSGN
jgi:DNA-binding NtrC family response regulator